MKTIKRKISAPFLIMLLMIPFMIMVLFNITMNIYIDRASRQELKNAAASVEILVKQQLMDDALGRTREDTSPSVNAQLVRLREGLKFSKLSLLNNVKNMNVEFLLISHNEKVLFPKSFNDSFLNQQILKKAKARLANAKENTIVSFRSGGHKYLSTYQMLTDRPDSTHILFISSENQADDIVRIVNIMLLCVTVLSAALCSVVALAVSKGLSRPITRLSEYANKIGKGEFLTLPEDRSSAEIYALTSSMNEMSKQLRSYDEAQKSFLQNASHELRTPLMSIQGYAEGMTGGVFPDTVKTAGIICEESRRLNLLVEELLTLSRIENKNYKGELVLLNLADNIKEYVQRINGYAIKKGIAIALEIKRDPVTVLIDDSLLSQAIGNVISNCIKYASHTVEITLTIQEGSAVIKIHDDGAGIAEEDLPHIFERFFKGKKGDFGLGLSIAKSAMEFMGGSISAANGNGAVFTLLLPLS
jgi:two-component system sensor histidine kinase CssS